METAVKPLERAPGLLGRRLRRADQLRLGLGEVDRDLFFVGREWMRRPRHSTLSIHAQTLAL
jgi:hypothetical protein